MTTKPYFDLQGATQYHGDCLRVMPTFAPAFVDTVITDPPYHLTSGKRGGSGDASLNVKSPAGRSRVTTGFMGKEWDGGDVAFKPETWREVLRVCKPGAMLLAFGGTRTFHRLAVAIEDAGWEIRDCMMWLYGSGFPKSLDISKAIDKAAGAEREVVSAGKPVKRMIPGATQDATGSWIKDDGREFIPAITEPATDAAKVWNGWGTALKPAWEPIIVAMKPLDGTFAENAQRRGVAGMNIDGGRIELNGDYKCRANGRPSQTGLGDNYEATKANQPDTVGRWPANVIIDEEAGSILDGQTGELISGQPAGVKAGGKLNCFGAFAGGVPVTGFGDRGGASRFFYTAKASQSERESHNDHPTVKPLALMKYLCTLTATPTGGIVLDPFSGSGTTLIAARECGRPVIGIDLKEKHCAIARKRLAQGHLFGAKSA